MKNEKNVYYIYDLKKEKDFNITLLNIEKTKKNFLKALKNIDNKDIIKQLTILAMKQVLKDGENIKNFIYCFYDVQKNFKKLLKFLKDMIKSNYDKHFNCFY